MYALMKAYLLFQMLLGESIQVPQIKSCAAKNRILFDL
jgi:hypothetical protein